MADKEKTTAKVSAECSALAQKNNGAESRNKRVQQTKKKRKEDVEAATTCEIIACSLPRTDVVFVR